SLVQSGACVGRGPDAGQGHELEGADASFGMCRGERRRTRRLEHEGQQREQKRYGTQPRHRRPPYREGPVGDSVRLWAMTWGRVGSFATGWSMTPTPSPSRHTGRLRGGGGLRVRGLPAGPVASTDDFALAVDRLVALGFGGQGGEECRLRVFGAKGWAGDRGRVVVERIAVSTLSRRVRIFAVHLGPLDLRARVRNRM